MPTHNERNEADTIVVIIIITPHVPDFSVAREGSVQEACKSVHIAREASLRDPRDLGKQFPEAASYVASGPLEDGESHFTVIAQEAGSIIDVASEFQVGRWAIDKASRGADASALLIDAERKINNRWRKVSKVPARAECTRNAPLGFLQKKEGREGESVGQRGIRFPAALCRLNSYTSRRNSGRP